MPTTYPLQPFSLLAMPTLSMRPLSTDIPRDREEMLEIFVDSSDYTELVEGRPAGPEDVDDFFFGKPDRKDMSDKLVVGFSLDAQLIGCADMIRAFPESDCAWIGLLLFRTTHRRHGLGSSALQLLFETARSWNMRRIQIAVVSTNLSASVFWSQQGFTEIRRAINRRFTGEMIVMERPLQ